MCSSCIAVRAYLVRVPLVISFAYSYNNGQADSWTPNGDLSVQIHEYGTMVAVHHPVVAHPCTDLVCSRCPAWLKNRQGYRQQVETRSIYAPPAIIPSKDEINPLPLFRHCRRPPRESRKVPRHPEPRSLHPGVQELEIGKQPSFRAVLIRELFIHLHWGHFPRHDFICSRVIPGWGTVEVSGEDDGSSRYGGFESAPY